jgi:hypothetical protein
MLGRSRKLTPNVREVDRTDHAQMQALSARFRSTRPAIWSGVAHPVGSHTVADIAARTSLAARAKAGSGRLSWPVSSLLRFAIRLHATWEASRVSVSRLTISGSISAFLQPLQ